MSIFDKLKKTKKEGKKEIKKELSKKEKKEFASGEEIKEPEVFSMSGKGSGFSIISEPHISEKATSLEHLNKYIFKVKPNSNKIQIKQALHDLYNVEVRQVRIVNMPSKKRIVGHNEGHVPGYKKAIVKLKAGQRIEVLPK